MKAWLGVSVLGFSLLAGAAGADNVHLANGESFEDVIAEVEGDRVRIQLEFGVLEISAASVARIDSAASALSEYLERRERLERETASPQAWLDLARWARGRNLEHGYRESLLSAADLDPSLDELRPGMRELDYLYDPELDRWIPFVERMRREGRVLYEGTWVRREDLPRAEPQPEAGRNEVEEALSKTVELLARAQLEREQRETRQTTQTTRGIPIAPYGYPVAHFGGFLVSTAPVHRDSGDTAPAPAPTTQSDLFRRPPGSLLPVGGANSGTRIRQPGSLIPVRGSRR